MRTVFRNINLGCHGIPERCLIIRQKRMRICARCFGCNIGHVTGIIIILLNLMPSLFAGILCLTIMMIDWSAQQFLNLESNNYRRLLTGFLGGFGIVCIAFNSIIYLITLF